MHRLIPQWLARFVCARRGHPQTQHAAQIEGRTMVIHTCLCGDRQDCQVYGGQFPRRR